MRRLRRKQLHALGCAWRDDSRNTVLRRLNSTGEAETLDRRTLGRRLRFTFEDYKALGHPRTVTPYDVSEETLQKYLRQEQNKRARAARHAKRDRLAAATDFDCRHSAVFARTPSQARGPWATGQGQPSSLRSAKPRTPSRATRHKGLPRADGTRADGTKPKWWSALRTRADLLERAAQLLAVPLFEASGPTTPPRDVTSLSLEDDATAMRH
jgi:hypothetical protein